LEVGYEECPVPAKAFRICGVVIEYGCRLPLAIATPTEDYLARNHKQQSKFISLVINNPLLRKAKGQ
jgi:hypothetical protein